MSSPSPVPSSPKPTRTDTTQAQSVTPSDPVVSAETTAKVPENEAGQAVSSPSLDAPSPVKNEKGEHLLETPWTLWYDHKMPKTATAPQVYAEHLKKLCTFTTVEEFYRMYVNLVRPADLPKDANYHLFRNEVTPMWENFPNGGCWILKVKKKDPDMRLDLLWEQLVLASIGELFEEPKIVGVVLSTRTKADILAVWNSDGQNHHLILRISDQLRTILQLDRSSPIEYKSNLTAMKDKSTYRNGKLVVTKDKKKKKKNKNKNNADGGANNNNNASGTHEKSEGASKPNGGITTPAESGNNRSEGGEVKA